MKTRMKFLDYTLLTIFAASPTSFAYAGLGEADCRNQTECRVEDELLFSIKNKDGGDVASGSGIGNLISLPENGSIWASENANMGAAELSISAPSYVPFRDGQITKPIEFYVRSNYSAFVDRYEISVYRGTDSDLVEPLTRIPVEVNAITSVTWDGALPGKYRYRNGDSLIYVLKAYDKAGNFDETTAQVIRFVTPEEDERGNVALQDTYSKIKGQAVTKDEALSENLIGNVTSSNNLYRQNIPFAGSRVTIQGANLPEGSVYIDGESYPIDQDRKFSADFLLPVGEHQFTIEMDGKSTGKISRKLKVDVSGNSFFMVGIADITAYQNRATGAGKNSAYSTDSEGNAREDSVLADGRLAFYLKSKVDGRYTITAHADTKEQELKHLFSGFGRAYPEDVFRQLDPDLYYQTYGDDSSVYRDVDTMGRFYARVDWDKNQALWGNYNTGISGTEYGRYSRSLYGAALDWNSNSSTAYGDTQTHVRAFGSQAQSNPGRSEFLGTGGSLYYLRHTRILPGSDKVQVEVRDNLTGRVVSLVSLTRGVDYEINATQGRIILSRPLSQIVKQTSPNIISENPLNGYDQYLLVDYEYVPNDFEPESVSAGVRAQHWVTDNLAVGGTYVDENQAGSDYTLKGADITLKAGNGTYLKGEYTKTESTGAPVFYSDNGGLSFKSLGSQNPSVSGSAKAVEGRINLKELGVTERELTAGAWWHDVDAGYSNSNVTQEGEARREYGVEVSAEVTDYIQMYLKHSKAESGQNSYVQSQLSTEWRMSDDVTLTGEIKNIETKTGSEKARGTLAGVKYAIKYTSTLELYTSAQITLDDDSGQYVNNDAVTAGFKYYYGDLSSIGFEGTVGHRGYSTMASLEHRISSDHTVYTNYTWSEGNSDYNSVFGGSTGWTIGQRWRITDRLNIFNETQQLKDTGNEKGTVNAIGMDYLFDGGWSSSLSFQDGKLKGYSNGSYSEDIHRIAISGSISRSTKDMDFSTKLEYRDDKGKENRHQWLTTNKLDVKVDESLRLSGKFNFSLTQDFDSNKDAAKFIDSGVGFAWRPWDSNQWMLLGRYNFYYDQPSEGQLADSYAQRSHIFSVEGIYKLNAEWEFASKVAYRKGEKKYGYLGTWFDSSATFAAFQARYDLIDEWHLLGEYRMLDVKDGGVKNGLMVGVDKDITRNLRFGVGYNFTDFSDDLTKQDYKYKGFFINMVGYY